MVEEGMQALLASGLVQQGEAQVQVRAVDVCWVLVLVVVCVVWGWGCGGDCAAAAVASSRRAPLAVAGPAGRAVAARRALPGSCPPPTAGPLSRPSLLFQVLAR